MIRKKQIDIKRERVERFLKKYYPYMIKKTIEKKLDLAKDGIRRHVREGRKIPDDEIESLDNAIMKMIDSYLEDEKD